MQDWVAPISAHTEFQTDRSPRLVDQNGLIKRAFLVDYAGIDGPGHRAGEQAGNDADQPRFVSRAAVHGRSVPTMIASTPIGTSDPVRSSKMVSISNHSTK